MDSLIILKLLPLYLLIDSLLSVNPGGEGGAHFSTTTLCQVPTWRFRQLSGHLGCRSTVEGHRLISEFQARGISFLFPVQQVRVYLWNSFVFW